MLIGMEITPDLKDREKHRLTRYGVTPETYQKMLDKQDGGCGICHTTDDPYGLAVDHDEPSGRIRGLLCLPCNKAIGLLRHDAESCRNAAWYVESADSGHYVSRGSEPIFS